MPKLTVSTRDGREIIIDAAQGTSIMQTLRDAGLDELEAICGGVCSCATCHVYVDRSSIGALPTMSEDEDDLLDSSPHRTEDSRLSCQIRMSDQVDGIRIKIAPRE